MGKSQIIRRRLVLYNKVYGLGGLKCKVGKWMGGGGVRGGGWGGGMCGKGEHTVWFAGGWTAAGIFSSYSANPSSNARQASFFMLNTTLTG